MTRITRLAAAAVAVAALVASPTARADVNGLEPANHAIVASNAGFIGCLDSLTDTSGICVFAYARPEGVHVTVLADMAVFEETVDPNGTITATGSGRDRRVVVDATLPKTGAVHVESTRGEPSAGIVCTFCWQPTYVLHSDTLDDGTPPLFTTRINFQTEDTALVGGKRYVSLGPWVRDVNANWYGGPVSGAFVL